MAQPPEEGPTVLDISVVRSRIRSLPSGDYARRKALLVDEVHKWKGLMTPQNHHEENPIISSTSCEKNEQLADLCLDLASFEIKWKQFKQAVAVYRQTLECPLVGHIPRVWTTFAQFFVSRGKTGNAQNVLLKGLKELQGDTANEQLFQALLSLRRSLQGEGEAELSEEALRGWVAAANGAVCEDIRSIRHCSNSDSGGGGGGDGPTEERGRAQPPRALHTVPDPTHSVKEHQQQQQPPRKRRRRSLSTHHPTPELSRTQSHLAKLDQDLFRMPELQQQQRQQHLQHPPPLPLPPVVWEEGDGDRPPPPLLLLLAPLSDEEAHSLSERARAGEEEVPSAMVAQLGPLLLDGTLPRLVQSLWRAQECEQAALDAEWDAMMEQQGQAGVTLQAHHEELMQTAAAAEAAAADEAAAERRAAAGLLTSVVQRLVSVQTDRFGARCRHACALRHREAQRRLLAMRTRQQVLLQRAGVPSFYATADSTALALQRRLLLFVQRACEHLEQQ